MFDGPEATNGGRAGGPVVVNSNAAASDSPGQTTVSAGPGRAGPAASGRDRCARRREKRDRERESASSIDLLVSSHVRPCGPTWRCRPYGGVGSEESQSQLSQCTSVCMAICHRHRHRCALALLHAPIRAIFVSCVPERLAWPPPATVQKTFPLFFLFWLEKWGLCRQPVGP
jgi:hypothetical protein